MKKTLLLLGAMASMLFAGMGQALAQTNLLPNGDFEAWTNGKPDKWAGKANNATLTQSEECHGGSYAVKVGATAGSNKRLGSSELNLKAGSYKVSFYAKGGQVRPGHAIVVAGSIDGSSGYKYGDYVTLKADEWTLVEYAFTLEAATTVDIIVMNPKSNANANYTATDVIIDDVTLTTEDGGIDDVETTWTEVTMQQLSEAQANIANVNLTLTNAKVVYVDGNTAYVREGANAIQFYNTGLELPLNAVLNGKVKGNFVLYNLMPELTAVEGETSLKDISITNSDEAAVPVQTTVAEILEMKHRCDLVMLNGITVVKDGTKYYAVDGANRVQFYKGLDMSGYADDGKAYNVTGLFNATYNKAPEIQPIAVEENQTVVVVPTPKFLTEEGSYESQVEVSIEVPEGCNVFYTTDGTEPDDSKTLYEAPFVVTETTTVKAVSYDENDQKSAVVEATYTITQPVPVVEGEATSFNFVANEWQLPVSTGQAQDAGNVTEVEVNGVKISFVFDAEGTGAKPRLWQGNTYTDLRVYTDQQIVAVAAAGKAVAQVKFYGAQASDLKLADLEGNAIDAKKMDTPATAARRAATATQSKAVATYTPSAAAQSVGVKATATTKITEIEVISVVDTGVASVERSFVGNKTYDLQGRRVMNAQKGIFIQNGQKIIK